MADHFPMKLCYLALRRIARLPRLTSLGAAASDA
jgi:hypothetical protein